MQMTVVKTRSVEYMPFFLSFFLFLNGGIWSVYSLLVKDYFIGVRTQAWMQHHDHFLQPEAN
jgi:solute carrier family 50 protein (sugar transporter)